MHPWLGYSFRFWQLIKFDTRNLKGDFFGGITAGVVALPLALAMGVASGLGPMAGLYGAILIGFFASLFGGTEPQVSGPTGPMTVVVAGLVASIATQPALAGNVELIFTTIIIAGIIQILFGIFKFGDYINLVPYPVVSGFMSGIGVIIIILQINPLFGHEAPAGIIDALLHVAMSVGELNVTAVMIGVLTLAISLKWPSKLGKYIPAPLAALVIGTLASVILGNVPVLGEIPTGLPQLHLPSLPREAIPVVLQGAMVLAALGSIDSLLTSLVSDNMTSSRHKPNQELIGQGIGNTIAGLFGGTAGAGATMRTVVNIRNGGKTRISGIVHAFFLLAIVMGLGPLGSFIPHAALAGILIKVGLDIIDWSYLKRGPLGPRWDLALMLLVLGLTVFVDLISAVAVGVILAALAYVKHVAREQMESLRDTHLMQHTATAREHEILSQSGELISVFSFSGPLSFGAVADLGHYAQTQLKGGAKAMILDFERVPFLDISSAHAVETIIADTNRSGGQVYLCTMSDLVQKVLFAMDIGQDNRDTHHFETREQALEAALSQVNSLELNKQP